MIKYGTILRLQLENSGASAIVKTLSWFIYKQWKILM